MNEGLPLVQQCSHESLLLPLLVQYIVYIWVCMSIKAKLVPIFSSIGSSVPVFGEFFSCALF